jgi:hypothetical protein
MGKKPKDPREVAARALCRMAGNPEDENFAGRPMWMSYLQDVDALLEAIRGKPIVKPADDSR